MGILRRLKFKIPDEKLKIVAAAIFNSLIRYGIAAYYKPRLCENDPVSSELNRLQVLQNDMVRLITGHKRSDNIQMCQLRSSIKMMSVNQIACYHIIIEAYNIINHKSCDELHDKLTQSLSQSNMQTRSEARRDLLVPKVMKKSCLGFSYFAAKLWNSLTVWTKCLKSECSFKTAIKKWISNGGIPS